MSFTINRALIKVAKLALLAGGLALLTGCQSKNPMDYLPDASGGYAGANIAMMKESAGLKRLGDELEKMQPGANDIQNDKTQKIYIAFDAPTANAQATNIYGVATGLPGFAEEVVAKYKSAGASEGKTSGRTTYTSGPVSISPVGTTGILFYQNSSMLDRMINVSKKKETNARASREFTFVDSELSDHAIAVAAKAQPLVSLAGPMLLQLEAMHPTGAGALKQVSTVSLAFNWDKQPVVEVKLHVADKGQSDALAGMINQFLVMAKMNPMLAQNPAAKQVVDPVQATSAEDGVSLKLEVPEEIANKTFEQLDQLKARQGGAPGLMPAGAVPGMQ